MPNGFGRLRQFARARSLLLVVLLAAAAVTVSVSPARADSWRGTVQVGAGHTLNIRSTENTLNPPIGRLADGTVVTIDCQMPGERVNGNWGPTTIWDAIEPGPTWPAGWVSDGFVYTGTNEFLGACF
jgi:hypothetical protein